MLNRQTDVLSGIFHSRGYAFRIVGRGSNCPDTNDVERQFIAEAVQALNLTELRKLHLDPTRATLLIEKAAGPFTPDYRLQSISHCVWRKLNRIRTQIDRCMARWFLELEGG